MTLSCYVMHFHTLPVLARHRVALGRNFKFGCWSSKRNILMSLCALFHALSLHSGLNYQLSRQRLLKATPWLL